MHEQTVVFATWLEREPWLLPRSGPGRCLTGRRLTGRG